MALTSGRISQKLFRFALPLLFNFVLSQAYSLIDTFIIARFAGESSLAALSSATAVLGIGWCLINGAGAACQILFARYYVRPDKVFFKNTVFTVSVVGTLFSALIAIVYCCGASLFLSFVELPTELRELCVQLIRLYALGFPIQLASQIGTGIFMGAGNSRTPLWIGVTSQVLNLVLDVICVVALDWGALGAAGASVFSTFISLVLCFLLLRSKQSERGKQRMLPEITKEYLHLGSSSMIQQAIISIGYLLLQRVVNRGGIEAINGYTIAGNLNNFLLIPIIAYTAAFETFASQNLGAKKNERVWQGYRELLKQCGFICILLSAATALLAKPLVSIYLSNPEGADFQFAHTYLLLLIPNYFLLMMKYSLEGVFKANLKPFFSTTSSFLSLAVRVVISYAAISHFGLLSLAAAILIGNAVSVIACLCFLRKTAGGGLQLHKKLV